MLVRSDRLAQLASPAFIVALSLLLLNDFALKPLFHNALTGKLSDFVGLFALTLFVATLWPSYGRIGAWAIAAAFTFWKSSYAEPLIEALNGVSPVAFARTVDLTDLVALPMILLALWAAPRLQPLPLPRALQVGLAVLAPLAFTATSQPRSVVRSTLDVNSVAVVDEATLRAFFDDVAEEHGLQCKICDSLDEGRVYSRPDLRKSKSAVDSFTVNFDAERGRLFYATVAFGAPGREDVLALSAGIRAGMQQRFPDVETIEFADDFASLPENSTLFTIKVSAETAPSDETAEQANRTFEAIIVDIARAHGLRRDEADSVYYLGRRFGSTAYDRDLALIAVVAGDRLLRVRVSSQTANYAALQQAIIDELASHLETAFGADAVTRERATID